MKKVFLVFVIMMCSPLHADEVYTIQVEKSYDKYSKSDLKKRVWELERAVFQLQQKVFALEVKQDSGKQIAVPIVAAPAVDSWVCTMKGMGETYTATGGSKAVATANVTDSCKKALGSTFHCKLEKCEQ
jgi:hypothetical protein